MQLKLSHLFAILAAFAIWFGLLTQAPVPFLILAPFLVCTAVAMLLPRGAFLTKASLGFSAAVLFQFISTITLVTIGLLGGWRENIMPATTSLDEGSFLLVIGFTIWGVFVATLTIVAWAIARLFSGGD